MSTAYAPPRRRIRLFAVALAVAAVAALTLAPQRFVAPLRGAFMRLLDAVAPAIAWIPLDDAERVLNTILFVPLGVAIALLLSRRAWPLAILAAFALSAAVEYAQGSIPGRIPDPDDVLWNTVGGAIGVLAASAVRLVAAIAHSRQEGRATRT